MTHQIVRRDIIWGYLSQFLSMGSSLLLLPFILIYLDSDDIAVWYVFIAITSFIQLLEFGFLPTIARFFSYIYSGAKDIYVDVVPESNSSKSIDIKLLDEVFCAAKSIYLIISLLSLLIVVLFGTGYLLTLSYGGDKFKLIVSWLIYGGATVLMFYFGYYNALLKGRGDQTDLNKTIVLAKLANITFTIPFLYFGFGLISISIGMFCSVVVDRLLVRRFVYSNNLKVSPNALAMTEDNTSKYKKVIWHSAKKMGVVQLGNFLTVKCSVLIVSSTIGLKAAAMYGFSLQITSIAVIVSSMYFGLQLPLISSEQMSGNKDNIRRIFCQSLGLSWFLFFSYSTLILLTGDYLITFLGLNVQLLPRIFLFVFLIAAFLEMNHSLCTLYLSTKNRIVFMWPIFITGLFISIFSIFFGLMYGLWGVILSQFLMQLIYNNWKWPLLAFKDLNVVFYHPILSLLRRNNVDYNRFAKKEK